METLSVATAAFHTICKNRKPSQTSDANPRNPTAPSCPVRRKLWEPHPRRTWTLPEQYLQLCESAFIYDIILELFQRSWQPDTGHLDQKSRLYHTRFSCLRAWRWVGENCGLTTLDFPRDVLTRISQCLSWKSHRVLIQDIAHRKAKEVSRLG